jgi:hypothetical protein
MHQLVELYLASPATPQCPGRQWPHEWLAQYTWYWLSHALCWVD